MSNYINKYNSVEAYEADETKQYPNISLIEGEGLVWQKEGEPIVWNLGNGHFKSDWDGKKSTLSDDINVDITEAQDILTSICNGGGLSISNWTVINSKGDDITGDIAQLVAQEYSCKDGVFSIGYESGKDFNEVASVGVQADSETGEIYVTITTNGYSLVEFDYEILPDR